MKQLINYLLRNLRRHLILSVLIVISLSVGLVSAYFVLSHVRYELSYDAALESIFRINLESLREGEAISRSARTPPAIGEFLSDQFPEIEEFSRLVLMGEVIIKTPADAIREKNVLLADITHFNQFNYSWVEGDASRMDTPFQLVIDSLLAVKLFGNSPAAGKTVEINSPNFEGTFPFTITGVVKAARNNSHLKPLLLISYATLHKFIGEDIDQSWTWNNVFTYVTLSDISNVAELGLKSNELLEDSRPDFSDDSETNNNVIFQPIGVIHTDPSYTGEFSTGVDLQQLAYLGILAGFILMLTILNFVNLFIVRTLGNAKQMGIRSVLGSSKASILGLQVADIVFLNLLSFGLSLTMIQVLNPYVAESFQVSIEAIEYTGGQVVWLIIAFFVCIAITTAIPVIRFFSTDWAAMATRRVTTGSSLNLRWYSGILGVQFFIAFFFISGLIVVYDQLWQISRHNPGFTIRDKWVIKAPFLGMNEVVGNQDGLLRSEMQAVSGVNGLVAMNEVPGSELYWRNDGVGRKAGSPVPSTFAWLAVGEGYFELFELNIVAGRPFDATKDNHNNAIILNETGAAHLGFASADNAVGQKIFLGEFGLDVVGIVKDFNQESVKKLIEPQYFRYAPEGLNYFVLDVEGEPNHPLIRKSYEKVFPGAPFEMYNLEMHYNTQYAPENRLSKLILFLSVVALLITLVGIVGLAMQVMRKRAKELVIRKVHGASDFQLWHRVAILFYRVAGIAYLIAIPVAFYVFRRWTSQFTIGDFPYLEFILIPGVLLGGIVMLSITIQVLGLTRINPGKILVAE